MTELPTTFGKYYLTEKLATGGMAEIYLAKIIGPGGFEKPLVIKQIHPRLSGQRHFVDLFVAEAKTLVTLTHGNIVPVYELGVVDDTYFIAMDYIDGPTLYRLTERMAQREARMDSALAAWITARMLEGLDYAHRKGEGVIHRDLSPRNVMLSRDGEVKLVDFGIATTLGDPNEDTAGSAPTGSFPYMSPEQVRRDPLTVTTDLFSAGVLMWEMLTGRRLFQRADADATLAAVLREPIPRPSSVHADVPAKLDDVVMRALERDRELRWPSAGDMLAAINKYLYSLDTTPGPREVGALVARFCPPETRRLPTHVEPVTPDDTSSPADDERPASSGPATAVIPKRPATSMTPRGKPRRQESFATNVDLVPILTKATGQVPALDDDEPGPTSATATADAPGPTSATADEPPAHESRRSVPRMRLVEAPLEHVVDPSDPDAPIERPPPRLPVPGREAPSRGTLLLAGAGAIALAAASVWMFYRGRDRVLHGADDAASATVDDDAASADAGAAVTPVADAGAAVDAATVHADAGVRADAGASLANRSDASTTIATSRADAAIRGTATLQIGADPWGEIYIDGKLMGRTPRELAVPAGRHTIEIVFPVETPPRKQTFAVDLSNGDVKPIQADFKN